MRSKSDYAAAAGKVAKLSKAAREATSNDSDGDIDANPGMCCAWGCELFGTRGEAGGSRWLCAAHDGIIASEWHTVTNRIRNRLGAFDACMKVLTSAPIHSNWHARALSFLERHGLSHFLDEPNPALTFTLPNGQPASARKFFTMLHAALIAECRKDLATTGDAVTVRTTSGSGLIDIGNLIG
jgi:hypothetical protein